MDFSQFFFFFFGGGGGEKGKNKGEKKRKGRGGSSEGRRNKHTLSFKGVKRRICGVIWRKPGKKWIFAGFGLPRVKMCHGLYGVLAVFFGVFLAGEEHEVRLSAKAPFTVVVCGLWL